MPSMWVSDIHSRKIMNKNCDALVINSQDIEPS